MKNINEFINEWEKGSKHLYSEHIDFFINKKTFNYGNCLAIMKNVRTELNNRRMGSTKLMIRIQCGQSKKIQEWGQQFWQLVDANLTPPELFIGGKIPFNFDVANQVIVHVDQTEYVENYIVFHSVEDGFIRCLDLVEKEVAHE